MPRNPAHRPRTSHPDPVPMRFRRPAVLLIALVLAGCGDAPRPDPPPPTAAPADAPGSAPAEPPTELAGLLAGQGYHALPMRSLATGHFVVDGSAGGTSFALIVDTGATHTILDRQRARRFRLALREERGRATGLGGADQAVATAVLREVTLGPLHLDSLPVSVLDLAHVNQTLRGAGAGVVDGIIGADLLMRGQAVIDYATTRLYLRDGAAGPAR